VNITRNIAQKRKRKEKIESVIHPVLYWYFFFTFSSILRKEKNGGDGHVGN